jgi:hypothetical protein
MSLRSFDARQSTIQYPKQVYCTTPNMSDDKTVLEKSLGKLLGSDDGTSDVLHYLLTIESQAVS